MSKRLAVIRIGMLIDNPQYNSLYNTEHYECIKYLSNPSDIVYEIRHERGTTMVTDKIIKYEANRGTPLAIEILRYFEEEKKALEKERLDKALLKLRIQIKKKSNLYKNREYRRYVK